MQGVVVTEDETHSDLRDGQLAAEIALLGDLIAAASASPASMSQREIDETLGVPVGFELTVVPLPRL